MGLMEDLIRQVFRLVAEVELPNPFPSPRQLAPRGPHQRNGRPGQTEIPSEALPGGA